MTPASDTVPTPEALGVAREVFNQSSVQVREIMLHYAHDNAYGMSSMTSDIFRLKGERNTGPAIDSASVMFDAVDAAFTEPGSPHLHTTPRRAVAAWLALHGFNLEGLDV